MDFTEFESKIANFKCTAINNLRDVHYDSYSAYYDHRVGVNVVFLMDYSVDC